MKIVVGEGSCGIAAGAAKVYDKLASALDKSNELTITGCIGMCFLEPIVDIYDNGTLTRLVKVSENDCERIAKAVNSDDLSTVEDLKISEDDELFLKKQTRIALRHCGIINPEKISDYENTDGYKAVRKVLSEMTPEQVIEEIKISGLAGRGGAGFPTWFKWNAARSSDGTEKYLICNADEGDPGAFMDRAVIEGDPHNLIEGMLIGAYAIGAKEAIVYVRAEYPLAIKRLEKAIKQATEKGYLGNNIFGSGFSCKMRIKAGAGAFVCGEETALIESLEGSRGMPRLKPPFPAQAGYWHKPSNINNVETFANVSWIILNGGAAFASMGTADSKGTKVFALTGKIKKAVLLRFRWEKPYVMLSLTSAEELNQIKNLKPFRWAVLPADVFRMTYLIPLLIIKHSVLPGQLWARAVWSLWMRARVWSVWRNFSLILPLKSHAVNVCTAVSEQSVCLKSLRE